MNRTRPLMSACLSPEGSFTGIGIAPQLPEPPLDIFNTNPSSRLYFLPRYSYSVMPLYLLETSIQAGPTICLSTAWQSVQVFFLARSGMSIAIAVHAHISPADRLIFATTFFMNHPFLKWQAVISPNPK